MAHKHLVHSMFKGWEHLNDYFLAVLIARLTNSLEQRREVLAAHLKFLQAFSVRLQHSFLVPDLYEDLKSPVMFLYLVFYLFRTLLITVPLLSGV